MLHRNSLCVLFVGLIALTGTAVAQPAPDARPNIVFAIADDWGYPHAGAYGYKAAKTPTFDRLATQGIHVDHHAMWIDPNDPDHFVVGDDGGISITWDGGGSYDFAATLPIAQFYSLSFDFETPYNVCAGAQDNGSWCGPSRRKQGTVTNAYWFKY